MELKTLKYAQHEGTPNEWRIQDCVLGHINLVVGRNATGKSRMLRVIKGLANLVSGDMKLQYTSGSYDVEFGDDSTMLAYSLTYEDSQVTSERLAVDGDVRLERGSDGKGQIFAELEGRKLEFQTPVSELACVNRRDLLQHAFFEPLCLWGKAMRWYPFSTPLGKERFALLIKGEEESDVDLKNPDSSVILFHRASREFPGVFQRRVIDDMCALGYDVDQIGTGKPQSMKLTTQAPGQVECLIVNEKDLACETDQHDMSQGMFRALALLIHMNYAELAIEPSCVIIDDIGEGLDFERSSALIELLIEKANRTEFQLIMSTNDRFVMNKVPLEYWCILQRSEHGCRILNYANSREFFDDFELTGLSNFDLFSGDFLPR